MFRLFVSLWMVVLFAGNGFCAYSARLFFRDATTGVDGPGEVIATPGDLIEVWFSFHKIDTVNPYKWGTLQITLCFDSAMGIVEQADKDNWEPSIYAAKASGGPPSDFLTTVVAEGYLGDDALDPSGGDVKVCDDGVYILLGMRSSAPRTEDWDVLLWAFTIQQAGIGQTLNWARDGYDTATRLSTRILDQKNKTVDVTDNWVAVVPEPGSLFVFAILLALVRRRKEP